ncbi:hypothetical protein DFQ01_13078 [Paenibacillus cellulosilyticus]|uniref:Nucleotidyltransferase AbiEii toxin of type IV toxin-antitoxin system n=1 Tax=Paenibacillus cellulosilyticus TaxID=375489 RepID=A0A2V2YMR1_9BACL|nr:hypothetical protein [Paenibacillus cellulosilyticus]PWV94513.1 hypothetical protein DFQ01_13078 [Paenibacillus cellulosilyticus]QKS45021.1 hypothetical protein HUB94_11805 [Paenibacillus cellulosilyticus]
MTIVEQADRTKETAHQILRELQLLERWREVGEPIVVGATAYELMISPDIDMEIYCDLPKASVGFQVLAQCVEHPNVTSAKYVNLLDTEDQGIYYQMKYRHEDGIEWKLDMWLMAHDHPGPCARDLVEPLKAALTDDKRHAILDIKQHIQQTPGLQAPSIQIYEAVIDWDVRNIDQFLSWQAEHGVEGLTHWKPSV